MSLGWAVYLVSNPVRLGILVRDVSSFFRRYPQIASPYGEDHPTECAATNGSKLLHVVSHRG